MTWKINSAKSQLTVANGQVRTTNDFQKMRNSFRTKAISSVNILFFSCQMKLVNNHASVSGWFAHGSFHLVLVFDVLTKKQALISQISLTYNFLISLSLPSLRLKQGCGTNLLNDSLAYYFFLP